MKRWLLHFAVFAATLALGGFLVAASGIIPIKASSGHWPITRWLLKFGMHRSFATHSMGVKPPRLDDPNLILKGATHYDFGCRSCHGSPGGRQPRIAQHMTPEAPGLQPLIAEWKPKELFMLVKHGVKFTGMPAWPSQQRDDEVWAMVAFLQKLPGLDAAGYEQLARGDPAATPPIQLLVPTEAGAKTPFAVNQSCVRCHGSDGLGRGSSAFPKLAGQRQEYLENAMHAYSSGARHSGIMQPIAAGLGGHVIRELALYYSELPRAGAATRATSQAEAELIALGRTIAHEGVATDRIPACVECHGPIGRRTKPSYPLLSGQPADYLMLQLELFKEGRRGGSDSAHLMREIAPRLSASQMRAVARYFESLPLDALDASTSVRGGVTP